MSVLAISMSGILPDARAELIGNSKIEILALKNWISKLDIYNAAMATIACVYKWLA